MFVVSARTPAAVLEQAADLGQGQSTAAGLGLRSGPGARRARPGTTPPALRPAMKWKRPRRGRHAPRRIAGGEGYAALRLCVPRWAGSWPRQASALNRGVGT